MLCLLHIPETQEVEITLNGTIIDATGFYFIVHAGLVHLTDEGSSPYPGKNLDEGTLTHADQLVIHRIPKSAQDNTGDWKSTTRTIPPTPLFVDVASIVGPCVAYQDVESENPHDYFVL
jgi:hypothetical protein